MTDRILTVTSQAGPSGASVVNVIGELDLHTAPDLSRVIEATPFGPGEPVVIDLSRLAYCDSTGITVLINAYRRAEAAEARLFLAGLSDDLTRVFRIIGLDQVFAIQPSVEQALDALKG
ncbi:STAS domain-containing protein [Actinocorallia longicatena]|uniref:Anti-sigma factor antagonist n=1 Tax=Actinocorallia longicatena TaxID=111803 RepID=A0ABP6Q7W6_9ACTN